VRDAIKNLRHGLEKASLGKQVDALELSVLKNKTTHLRSLSDWKIYSLLSERESPSGLTKSVYYMGKKEPVLVWPTICQINASVPCCKSNKNKQKSLQGNT
jgi:hypothetical protein